MVIQVVASIFDDFRYYWNLRFLQRALQNDKVAFVGVVSNHASLVFNKARIYAFTHSAKSTIQDNITNYLIYYQNLRERISRRSKNRSTDSSITWAIK